MLDVTHNQVDVEIESGVVLVILKFFISFSFDKMIFRILQVSRDHKALFTAPVRYLTCVVYCKKGHCLETMRV